MQDKIEKAGKMRSVPEEAKQQHKGFREWDSKVDPRDHQSIIEVFIYLHSALRNKSIINLMHSQFNELTPKIYNKVK